MKDWLESIIEPFQEYEMDLKVTTNSKDYYKYEVLASKQDQQNFLYVLK
jgi:hypothetical protein